MAIEVVEYYSLQNAGGSFGVYPSPINAAWEKEEAFKQHRQRVEVTMGDLKIVVLIIDDIDDATIYKWLNYLKEVGMGLHPEYARSTYWEDEHGNGHEESDDFDDEE